MVIPTKDKHSKLGYTENNVQWVHKDINRIKSNFTEEYLFKMIKTVYEYQKL